MKYGVQKLFSVLVHSEQVQHLFYVVLLILKEKLSILQHIVGMEVKLHSLWTLIWITKSRYWNESPFCKLQWELLFFGNAQSSNIVVEFPSVHYCENVSFISCINLHLITLWKNIVFQVFMFTVERNCFKWVVEWLGRGAVRLYRKVARDKPIRTSGTLLQFFQTWRWGEHVSLKCWCHTAQCVNTRYL